MLLALPRAVPLPAGSLSRPGTALRTTLLVCLPGVKRVLVLVLLLLLLLLLLLARALLVMVLHGTAAAAAGTYR